MFSNAFCAHPKTCKTRGKTSGVSIRWNIPPNPAKTSVPRIIQERCKNIGKINVFECCEVNQENFGKTNVFSKNMKIFENLKKLEKFSIFQWKFQVKISRKFSISPDFQNGVFQKIFFFSSFSKSIFFMMKKYFSLRFFCGS